MHPIEVRSLGKHTANIGRLLLEMGMIVFGILLALNLESRKEKRHERELAKTALHNIRHEIEQNKKNIETFMPRQKEMMKYYAEQLQKNMKGTADKKEELLLQVQLYPALLLQTAWDTANITKALARTDYNLIQELAELYLVQKWLGMFEDKWLQAFINPISFQSENRYWFLCILTSLVFDYITTENAWLKSCDAVLPKLGGN